MIWQDISTAPRDGTDVIVMYMHIETQCIFNAFYVDPSDEAWGDTKEGWWSYEHGETARILLEGWMEPTHWMPLPLPPMESDNA